MSDFEYISPSIEIVMAKRRLKRHVKELIKTHRKLCIWVIAPGTWVCVMIICSQQSFPHSHFSMVWPHIHISICVEKKRKAGKLMIRQMPIIYHINELLLFFAFSLLALFCGLLLWFVLNRAKFRRNEKLLSPRL